MKTKLFSFLGLIGFTLIFSQDIISTFDTDDEGWLVVGDATSSAPDWHSTNGNPGGYISADDTVAGGVWYWEAPSKFKGNQLASFGRNLKFQLTQNNFSSPFDYYDVIIEGNNKTLVIDLFPNPLATWTQYVVKLDNSVAWKISTFEGDLATNIDIQEVLSNIVSLKIRGEFESGPDTGQLDNVILESNSLSVDDIQNKKFQVYPNPTKDYINHSKDYKKLEVISVDGRVLMTNSNNSKINLSDLSAGIYIIRVYNLDDSIRTFKVIKK
ncbi:MAG: T9SS type A sorting domain-containing protein [Chryseobacterium sp.]|nr:T9SS type A sorting domain-containing protein [Chryseobacterium sp.]